MDASLRCLSMKEAPELEKKIKTFTHICIADTDYNSIIVSNRQFGPDFCCTFWVPTYVFIYSLRQNRYTLTRFAPKQA
ncbi:protein of unknown function [Rhodovastum atsumiense]|nr:protein of unknown function [Rhodovastum atsumiense]